MKKKIVFGILMLFACFALTGCGCSKKEYSVKFDTHGGSTVSSQTIADGETATKPADPTRDGYTFGGWYLDLDDNQAFDFNQKITSDITLHAKWLSGEPSGGEDDKCTKTCDSGYTLDVESCTCVKKSSSDDDSSKTVAVSSVKLSKSTTSLTVGNSETLKFTVSPSNATNKTATWKSSNTKVVTVDKNGKITAVGPGTATVTVTVGGKTSTITVTVKAKEQQPSTTPKTFTVTFDTKGGSAVSSQTITDGKTATKPADPTKDGYTFDGWLLDGKAYDFNSKVTGNITLTAKWTEIKYTYVIEDDGDLTSFMYNVRVYEGSKEITSQVAGIFGSSKTDLLGTYSPSMGAIRIPKGSEKRIAQIAYNDVYYEVTEKK